MSKHNTFLRKGRPPREAPRPEVSDTEALVDALTSRDVYRQQLDRTREVLRAIVALGLPEPVAGRAKRAIECDDTADLYARIRAVHERNYR